MHDEDDGLEDDFGPGSDLVLSLLAVAILLLAMAGVSRHLDFAVKPPLAEPPQPSRAGPEPVSEDMVPRAVLEKAEQAYADLVLEVRELERRMSAMQAVPDRVVAFSFDSTNAAFFLEGSAELRPPARQFLEGQVPTLVRLAVQNNANHLEVVGFASAEPDGDVGRDRNMELSARRALAVADALAAKGLPTHCISVAGMGRGRSQLLQMYLARRAGNSVEAWDRLMRTGQGAEIRRQLEDELAKERRVEIALTRDSGSPCKQDELVRALAR